MRIAYFSCQMPYPPMHGGTVDDWARLNALKALGADLALVTWYADNGVALPTDDIAALGHVASVVHALPVTKNWLDRMRRLAFLWRWPSQVSSRIPKYAERVQIWRSLDAFQPQAIWLDALYPIWMAKAAAARYGVPIYYRSHNIEHLYMRGQIARSTSWRDRFAWAMNLPHLRRVELDAWRNARVVFDISMDDLSWWQKQGFFHGVWLPPLVQPDRANRLLAPLSNAPAFDVAYLGNLQAPNNTEGVLWFLRKVWPRLLVANAELRFLLAGSTPTPEIRQAISTAPNAVLLENPADVVPVLRNAQVLINPVFGGSGVNVKSVEMLFSPARLVSTPQGVAGLPPHVVACFSVATDPEGFACAIEQALGQHGGLSDDELLLRQQARMHFDFARAQDVLSAMQVREIADGMPEPMTTGLSNRWVQKVRSWSSKPIAQRWLSMRYRLDSALFSLHTKLHAFDFDGHIPNQELIADSAVSLRHATAYLPYSRMTFKILMAEAQRTGINFVSFLDVGCGKGKPCLLAAQHYEFQAIQGIDFSQPLVDIANKNLAKTKYTNIQFIKCDATQFKLMGGNTVVYLFNPFNDIVLRAFLLLNMDHFTQNQSVIAYANDDHRHVLAELGFEVVYRSQVLKQSVWRINSSQPTLSYPSGGSTPSTVV